MSNDRDNLKNIIEAALLAAGRPLGVDALLALFLDDEQPDRQRLKEALESLAEDYAERGIEIAEVATGWRIQVRSRYASWVSRLWEEKPPRYSRALMETLALIAYRQPITRGEIEEIRGVTVSTNIVKTLLERDWVRVVGQRDVPGKPSLYATTRGFLDYFGLKSLDDLPTLSEIKDLDSLNTELPLGDAAQEAADDSAPSSSDAEGEGSGESSLTPEAADADKDVGQEEASAREASTESETEVSEPDAPGPELAESDEAAPEASEPEAAEVSEVTQAETPVAEASQPESESDDASTEVPEPVEAEESEDPQAEAPVVDLPQTEPESDEASTEAPELEDAEESEDPQAEASAAEDTQAESESDEALTESPEPEETEGSKEPQTDAAPITDDPQTDPEKPAAPSDETH